MDNGTVHIGKRDIIVEIADTEPKHEIGLGGKSCISEGTGMLFVYKDISPSNRCFWMKDMKFPIDIVWLDKDKKVIYMKENVQPNSYPEKFCPGKDSQYVLELGAKNAASLGLKLNDSVTF